MKELSEDNVWWHGPEWLADTEQEWPLTNSVERQSQDCSDSLNADDEENTLLTDESPGKHNSTFPDIPPYGIDSEKYSSMSKLVRVTTTVMRFINRLRGEKFESPYMTAEELDNAENMWIRHIQRKHFSNVSKPTAENRKNNLQKKQLGVFLDENNILRCKGRMKNASLDERARQPVLLPSKDNVTSLIIQRVHKQLLHGGISHTLSQLRYNFWIPRGRATVHSVLKHCTVCKRFDCGPYKVPKTDSLPRKRVSEATPFSNTGLDYFSPIMIKISENTRKYGYAYSHVWSRMQFIWKRYKIFQRKNS